MCCCIQWPYPAWGANLGVCINRTPRTSASELLVMPSTPLMGVCALCVWLVFMGRVSLVVHHPGQATTFPTEHAAVRDVLISTARTHRVARKPSANLWGWGRVARHRQTVAARYLFSMLTAGSLGDGQGSIQRVSISMRTPPVRIKEACLRPYVSVYG